jgi:Coenzyme PQQ synthesis protein D (PqqD)
MSNELHWDAIKARNVTVPRHVVFRAFAAETVLLNVQTGVYHGLDDVGGRFFELLRDSPSVSAAADAIVSEYDVPADRVQEDMARFCGELQGLGLIELAA